MEDESRDGSHARCAAGAADARTCSASACARRRSLKRPGPNLSRKKGPLAVTNAPAKGCLGDGRRRATKRLLADELELS